MNITDLKFIKMVDLALFWGSEENNNAKLMLNIFNINNFSIL